MRIVSRFRTALTAAILSAGLLTLALPAVSRPAQQSSTPQDLNSLLEALRSRDPAVAMQAAQEMKKKDFPAKDVVPALAHAMKHPNEVVRLTAIEALSDRGPEGALAVPALREALRDKDPLIREAAILALFSIGKQATAIMPDLLVLLGDEHKSVREIVAMALAGMGRDAVPGLVKALQSKDSTVRDSGFGSPGDNAGNSRAGTDRSDKQRNTRCCPGCFQGADQYRLARGRASHRTVADR